MSVFDVAADLQWTGTGGSAFRGAEWNRLYADRVGLANHPDNEVRYSIRALRARARDLVRNNPYAGGILDSIATNVIGERGIRLKPKIVGPDGEPARDVNHELVRGWEEWGDEYASVDTVDGWLEIEWLLMKTLAQDGEIFLRRRRGWDNPHGYAVELLDPDLLDEMYNERPNADGVEIRMGVEKDRHGRPLAYHFFRHHPHEGLGRERVRLGADEIGHYFVRYRAGQSRGFSWFAPILTTVEMIDGYTEAELVAARYHASKMGFIENTTPEAQQAWATRFSLQNQEGKKDQPRKVRMAPGLVEELIPGQHFVGFDPTHPNTSFDPFLKSMLRGVARAFSVSYLTLTGDVSEANYSSMRAGLLPERDQWRILQRATSRRVHRRIYRDWLAMALLTRAVELPSPIASDYYRVEWLGRRWPWVDPAKDVEGARGEIQLGLNSRTRAASDRGHDYETIVEEREEEEQFADEHNVDVGLQTAAQSSQDDGAPDPPPPPATNGTGAAHRIAHHLET